MKGGFGESSACNLFKRSGYLQNLKGGLDESSPYKKNLQFDFAY
jgi:hypothetical protein